jgi:hypothetical protein
MFSQALLTYPCYGQSSSCAVAWLALVPQHTHAAKCICAKAGAYSWSWEVLHCGLVIGAQAHQVFDGQSGIACDNCMAASCGGG